MKKILSIMLALVLAVLCLSGCAPAQQPAPAANNDAAPQAQASEPAPAAGEPAAAEEQLHLVFVTPLFSHPVWLVAKDGFDAAAKDLNFRGDWVGPNVIDADEMIKQIETAIAEKADGIITQGINPEAMVPVMKKCEEAGIPVVVVNSDIPDGPRLAYLGTEPVNFGNTGAKAILDKLGNEPIHAAFIVAALDYKIGLDMISGYEQVFETAPGGYTKLTVVADNADMLTGIQHCENIFNTYPECNVIVCLSGAAPPAAAKVVQEKGLVDKVLIMGIDDIEETVDGIKDGVIYGTMTQNFFRKGYQGAQWLLDYIKDGKQPPALLNDSGTMVVTKDNIDTYNVDMTKPETWK